MKKQLFFVLSVALLFACGKKPECVPPYAEGIAGKWKLVEGVNIKIDKRDYYVTFDPTGKVYASDYPCDGTYTFDEVPRHHPDGTNFSVEFRDCSPSYRQWPSISANASARLLDDNTLAISFVDCDEGCGVRYQRVCE